MASRSTLPPRLVLGVVASLVVLLVIGGVATGGLPGGLVMAGLALALLGAPASPSTRT